MSESPAQGAPVAPIECDYKLAAAYVAALTGKADTVMDCRALSDTDKSLPGHARRGTLSEVWPWITGMNAAGYGVFVTVNATDGIGRGKDNITAARAVWVDLDGIDAEQQYEAAAAWSPAPSFAVQTSPDRYHVYWTLAPGCPLDMAESINRRLRVRFNADKSAVDLARVLRLPGTYHLKADPVLVTCHQLAGYGQPVDWQALDAALADQPDHDGTGERHDLGTHSLAAPSLDWLKRAMELVDPNMLDRGAWISLTAAIKQAGWTLTDEATLRGLWADMCARYEHNDPAENEKQWRSIRESQLGWSALVARIPSLKAEVAFGPSGPPPLPPGASDTRLPVAANDKPKAALLPLVDMDTWNGSPPPRTSLWGSWLPTRQTTMLTGAGGIGKSLWEQCFCTAVALERPFLGMNTMQRNALYVTCEDDCDELWRRQESICAAFGATIDDVRDRLHLCSLTGEIDTALATFDSNGLLQPTERWRQLEHTCDALDIGLYVFDNATDAMAGDLNDLNQVAQFVALLTGLAMKRDGAAMIVHHPNKAGDEYLGSVGWHNKVRSRLTIRRPDANDPDGRVIENPKLNYGPQGGEIAFRWHRGSFVRTQDLPPDFAAQVAKSVTEQADDEMFLRCLSKSTERKINVSHHKGSNYYATEFAKMSEARGTRKEAFERAFQRLLDADKIAVDVELWKGSNRTAKRGIAAI